MQEVVRWVGVVGVAAPNPPERLKDPCHTRKLNLFSGNILSERLGKSVNLEFWSKLNI